MPFHLSAFLFVLLYVIAKCRRKTRTLQVASPRVEEGDPEQAIITTTSQHTAAGRTPPWRTPQGTPLRQPLWQDRTPLWRTLPGIPLKPPLWQVPSFIFNFIAVFSAIVMLMIVVSSSGSTSFSKNIAAPLSGLSASLVAFSVALTVIYVVGFSTSPTSSCLKKTGGKGRGKMETEELARPKRPPRPPTFLTFPAS